MPTSIELFSGCGGLATGMSRAGFDHTLLVEWNKDAHSAVLHNKKRGVEHMAAWPAICADVRTIKWTPYRGNVRVVTGGPPCQPFGIGGKKLGHEDARDMWPETVRAISEILPDAFIFENVRNLAGPRFSSYLEWVKECLRHPGYPRENAETHANHMMRLQSIPDQGTYLVDHLVVNAADYGAAQVRHRVLVRGVRRTLGLTLEPFKPTHSRDGLLSHQWVTGAYWQRHGIEQPDDQNIPRKDVARVQKIRVNPGHYSGLPWVTVRDAIAGLGEPDGHRNHVYQAGAKSYAGHTGSWLDQPSKALKAGDHGVPGGENMIRFENGEVRYLTTREAARLVGLPDEYLFPRSWTEAMRQMGNAVPAPLGEAIGQWLAKTLGFD